MKSGASDLLTGIEPEEEEAENMGIGSVFALELLKTGNGRDVPLRDGHDETLPEMQQSWSRLGASRDGRPGVL